MLALLECSESMMTICFFSLVLLQTTSKYHAQYREFSPYANFITANFVTAVFQNYIQNLANAIFCYFDHKIKIWLMRALANANFG